MKGAIGAAIAGVVVLLVAVPGGLLFGLFGLLSTLVLGVQEDGPHVPPVFEAAYRQVAADRARDWATLAAWDGADNRFELPVPAEADIFDQLVAAEERRRQRQADKECQALPPGSPCPDPEPLSEADLQHFRQKAHRDWYTLVLNHIRSHADTIRDADQADPEGFFDRVLARAKAQHAAELQVAYTILDQMGDDDHAITDPPDPPAAWTPVDGFAWPATGEITSRFGMRISPIDGKRRLHAGIDIAIVQGTRVVSSKAGTIVRADSDPTFGLVVVVDHGAGYETLYAHNSVLEVAVGAHVEQGQELSLSGTTGASTGPHLHFEVHYQGTPVDPMLLLGR